MKSQNNGEPNERLKLGQLGESRARAFLADNGYEILHRNWRYRHKEVDIIARQKDQLVFVEVRTWRRKFADLGPEATIGRNKQRFLIVAAKGYMDAYDVDMEVRFDVIAVIMRSQADYQIKHFEDAFFPMLGF